MCEEKLSVFSGAYWRTARNELKNPRVLAFAGLVCAISIVLESLLYRELFEKYYPGQAGMIVDYWMPNRAWPHCDVSDPSARVLAHYGASGQ